jgi:ribosomal protein L3 glutamine methyltransferase
MPWVSSDTHTILDMCTGSGCIGIACAVAFPDAFVDVADISSDALLVADRNIQRHGLASRVATIKSDLYEALGDKQYDLIVSNPPYVGKAELLSLPDEFNKEPRLGLDGGVSGLDLVHTLLAYADEHLSDMGILYIEVGNTADALQVCYPNVEFLWQEFERGGDGVFMLTKKQLQSYKSLFMANVVN